MQQPQVPDSGATVITESRSQISSLFGFLTAAFAVALVRGVTGASTGSGRVAAGVFAGVLVVAVVAGWIVTIRRPTRLEVSEAGIRYIRRNGQELTLSREWGDELLFVQRRSGRTWTLGLTIAGTGTVIYLGGFFSKKAVRQACLARGWRFGDRIVRQR
jgi:hypothetical protein